MARKFYVYELRDSNGKVFYIGKGSGHRFDKHKSAAKRGQKYRVYNKIRKLWREGLDFIEHRVFETEDEQAAFAEEKRLIAFYGRENLTNLTDGGEGISGHVMPRETVDKISAKLRGRLPWNKGLKSSENQCKRLSLALKGNHNAKGHSPSEEVRRVLSENHKGNHNARGNKSGRGMKYSVERRRHMSEALKGRKVPLEERIKSSIAHLGKPWSTRRWQTFFRKYGIMNVYANRLFFDPQKDSILVWKRTHGY